MARQSSSEKERLWRRLLVEHAQSGLTIKAFCQERGLQQHTFHFWKRRIRTLDQPSDEQKAGPIPLVPVKVVSASSPADSSPTIRIALPGSVVVEIFAEPLR